MNANFTMINNLPTLTRDAMQAKSLADAYSKKKLSVAKMTRMQKRASRSVVVSHKAVHSTFAKDTGAHYGFCELTWSPSAVTVAIKKDGEVAKVELFPLYGNQYVYVGLDKIAKAITIMGQIGADRFAVRIVPTNKFFIPTHSDLILDPSERDIFMGPANFSVYRMKPAVASQE